MYLCNIDFPNQIIDAIIDDKLVVFAGAGASVDKPTSLPNFVDLAKEIAEGTGQTLKKNEPCEVFLGTLKARGIDVNGIAASVLSSSCLRHNALHEAIVDLFISPDKVKIVTTNYDQMFEQVLEEKNSLAPVYNSPALPLGNDINGIIHIHGNVNDPKYMVVTDEDFGRAYLTDGYASRFLVKLFESYTVLFIGYSYNDTILRYLTRAMYRQHSANRFILTDDTKADWESLGISTIYFPKRSYAVMRNGLVKLGNHAKKGLWDWRNQFIEIADAPPKDLTIETEVEYCLENANRSSVLSNCIRGVEWLDLLDRKGAFSCCFSDLIPTDEIGKIWANWLCDKFVGSDDSSLKLLFTNHGNNTSKWFSGILLNKIIRDEKSLSNESFKEYMTLLDQNLEDQWVILKSIEIAYNRQLYHLSFHFFEKLFDISIKLERNIWTPRASLEPKHSMIGDYECIKHAWELIHEKVVPLYTIEALHFSQKTIETLHFMYEEMGKASRNNEPWSMSMIDVENHVKEYSKNPLHILSSIFLKAAKELSVADYTKSYLTKVLSSQSILLRKLALRAIRENRSFNYDEKIELICDTERLWFVEGKEQVFLLAQDAFLKASSEKQKKLIETIEKGPTEKEDKRNWQYAIYNWCVWLQRIDPINKRIQSIISEILKENNFAPREHPELNIVESDAVWVADKSPVTTQEMVDMPVETLADLLVDYKEDNFGEITRWGLLNAFSNSVKDNAQWASGVVEYLYSHRIDKAEIWNSLFKGFEEANLPTEAKLSLCELFTNTVDILIDVQELAHYLWTVLQADDIQQHFSEYEQILFELSLKLWNQRATSKPSHMRLIDTTINTTTGIVLMCWIYMVSYSGETSIGERYKAMFEEALQLHSWEREVAICILAGHFNFLCYRDRKWCINHFEPMLTGNNKKTYVSAWEGIVYFSRRISKDTADIMKPIYLKAVKNINWLEGEARYGFIEMYLTLLIFVVEKPTLKFIPAFYRSSSEEIRRQFVNAIGQKLGNLDTDIKLTWWNNWLKRYLENRKGNKPVELTEAECRSLFMLIPKLDFVIDEVVEIMCKGQIPSRLDYMFWYELNEKKLGVDHPHSIAKLLISLLRSIPDLGFENNYIIQIVESLNDLNKREKQQLQEALIKHNIIIPPKV